MSNFEVPSPILYSPFEEPKDHSWFREGRAVNADGRHGLWSFVRVKPPEEVKAAISQEANRGV
jgi:hypothetical protein